MAEAECSELSNTVFIDVASASQFPIVECAEGPEAEPVKEDHNNTSTSAIESFLVPQPRRIRCPECKHYTAKTEEKMLRHIRKIHRGENPFQCFICDYSTCNKVVFEDHVRRHQGIKPYKCSHCSYRSVSKKDTKRHELIHRHRPDKPHTCDQCGFIARHANSLKHHEFSHGKAVKECSVCNESFASEKSYTAHRKSGKRCLECKKMFCVGVYDQHRLEVHGVKKKEKRSSTKKKFPHKCVACEDSFEYNCLLKNHVRIKHFNLICIVPLAETQKINQVWFEKVGNTDVLVKMQKISETELLIQRLKDDTTIQPTDMERQVIDLRKEYPIRSGVNRNRHTIGCRVCKKQCVERQLSNHFVEFHSELVKKKCETCGCRFRWILNCARHICPKSGIK